MSDPTSDPLPDALTDRVTAHLRSVMHPEAHVTHLKPISGGACQDNLKVVVAVPGHADQTFVLRSDAPSGLPGSIDRRTEAAVITAAVAAGVPTPAARYGADDLVRPGAHAWLMDWVDGTVLGGKVARSPKLSRARALLPAQLGGALAAVHRVPASSGLPIAGANGDPVAFAVEEVSRMVSAMPVQRPAQTWAVQWLRDHAPTPTGHTLVHRDFRLGNLMVDPDAGLVAVLDWEFARYGDPAEDLGWFCVRDWRFGALHLGGGGVCSRASLLHAYAQASGCQIDIDTLAFWEILGNVRWAASAVLQGVRARAGGKRGRGLDVELLSIPRRAAEMEWEALRLIRRIDKHSAPSISANHSTVGDHTPPDVLVQAAVDWLSGPALDVLKGADQGVAFQARVVSWLLSGVAREVAGSTDASADFVPNADPQVAHDQLCSRLAAELDVVQPRFDRGEDGAA